MQCMLCVLCICCICNVCNICNIHNTCNTCDNTVYGIYIHAYIWVRRIYIYRLYNNIVYIVYIAYNADMILSYISTYITLFTWITYITYITYYVTHNILQYQKGSWEHPAQKAVLLFGHRGSFKRRSWTTEHGNDDVNLRCSRFSLWQLSSEGCICTNYSSRHCDYLMQTLSLHSSCDLWLEVACSIFWKRWMVGPLALQNLSRVSQVATSGARYL